MATAKRTKTKIIKEVPAFQVTLTEGEADFLIALLAKIGGDSTQSPRKYSDSIQRALVGAAGYHYPATDAYRLIHGGATCDSYPAHAARRYA